MIPTCLSHDLSDDEDNNEEAETLDDEEPELDTVMIQHSGAINRIRVGILGTTCIRKAGIPTARECVLHTFAVGSSCH